MLFKKIKEFEIEDRIDGFFMIKNIEVKTSTNGNKFLDITLSDNTGDINAKVWDYRDEDDKYRPNSIIKIRADVTEWQGRKQLKIMKIRTTDEADEVKREDFVQSAPISPQELYSEILEYVDNMENKDLKKLTSHIMCENKERILYYPAAKSNHHAIRSGLMYHVFRMLKTGEQLANIYEFINKDLLFAGIILHDMAKLEEMNSNELGIVSEYTKEGQLLGHLIQGIKNISKISDKLDIDPEVSLMIEHMILSHHYYADYGSPKKPMIPEAELLHYIDTIDAKMYDMEKSLSEVEDEEFTGPVWTLDKRRLYKSTIK